LVNKQRNSALNEDWQHLIDCFPAFVYVEVNYIDLKRSGAGITDIYLYNSQMKRSIDKKLVKFYLWVALPYLFLWVWHDVASFDSTFVQALLNNIWRGIYIVVIDFIFFEFVAPFVLGKKSYIIVNILLAIVTLWIFMLLWSYGLYAWRLLGVAVHVYTPFGLPTTVEKLLAAQMAFSVGSICFFGVTRHIYTYVKLKAAAQQLAIEKKEAELNYLKSQTNPHFLFNTLNNIYSLTRDKSDLAPESILRLSKILRFMLYEAGGEFISVEQELKIVTDYLELEKLRYDESLRINFNYDVEDMKQALPPLLLIPLVENAFKHGVSETRDEPYVNIHLSIRNRQLTFVVKNSTETNSQERAIKENIGLSNLRRQLELLYKEYNLSVKNDGSAFTAILKINLGSHVENKMHHN
jgi:two-component system LytT family sensor kinase